MQCSEASDWGKVAPLSELMMQYYFKRC